MNNSNQVTDTLSNLSDQTSGTEVSIGDLIESLNSKGYGTLLIAPAAITILPTGAIPGVPAVCAGIVFFISLQILTGFNRIWLPTRLKDLTINRSTLTSATKRAKPYTKWLDRFIHPRYCWLTAKSGEPFVASICIFLSLEIAILGFVPFFAALPASAILFMGIGLGGKDGLFILISLMLSILSIAILPLTWSILFDSLSNFIN